MIFNYDEGTILIDSKSAPSGSPSNDKKESIVPFNLIPNIKVALLAVKDDYRHDWGIIYEEANNADSYSKRGKSTVSYFFDNVIIMGEDKHVIADYIGEIVYDNDDYVVVYPDLDDNTDLEKYLVDNDVYVSPNAAPLLIPPSVRVLQVRKWAEEARDEGFREPTIFPTEEKLRPHQKDSVITLAHRGNMMISDEVGLGKTASFVCGALSLAQWRMEHNDEEYHEVWPFVIVTKKSLVSSAVKEIMMWKKDAVVEILTGGKSAPINPGAEFIVLHSDILSKRLDDILLCEPQGVVYDEAHLMKNPKAKRTMAAIKLSDYIGEHCANRYTICATATPIPNRPEELWSQLVLSGTEHYVVNKAKSKISLPRRIEKKKTTKRSRGYSANVTPQTYFEVRYCGGVATPLGWLTKDAKNVDELGQVLNGHIMVRRTKKDIMFPTPPLNQRFEKVVITPEQRQNYMILEDDFKSYVVDKLIDYADDNEWSNSKLQKEIKTSLSKVMNSEAIMKMTSARQEIGSMKIDHTVDWIKRFCEGDESITGGDPTRNKLIVFAYHKEVQNALIEAPEIQQYGVSAIISGTKNVSDIIDDFQDPQGKTRVLICYPGAREGLTLTAAKDIYITELPFMPDWVIQMAGRCWARMSRDYPPHEAYIHYAVINGTLDDYLRQMIIKKKDVCNAIINAEPEKYQDVDDEDLGGIVYEGIALDALEDELEDLE